MEERSAGGGATEGGSTNRLKARQVISARYFYKTTIHSEASDRTLYLVRLLSPRRRGDVGTLKPDNEIRVQTTEYRMGYHQATKDWGCGPRTTRDISWRLGSVKVGGQAKGDPNPVREAAAGRKRAVWWCQ